MMLLLTDALLVGLCVKEVSFNAVTFSHSVIVEQINERVLSVTATNDSEETLRVWFCNVRLDSDFPWHGVDARVFAVQEHDSDQVDPAFSTVRLHFS